MLSFTYCQMGGLLIAELSDGPQAKRPDIAGPPEAEKLRQQLAKYDSQPLPPEQRRFNNFRMFGNRFGL